MERKSKQADLPSNYCLVNDPEIRKKDIRFTVPVHQKPKEIILPPLIFTESLNRFPEWECVLFQHIYEQSNNCMTLREHIECADKIYLVTDGGSYQEIGYFGWSIATESNILLIGFGHVQGNPSLQESLRTEETSHLSLL
eukprot:9088491-Ditylum_brightwellii.AAC.1